MTPDEARRLAFAPPDVFERAVDTHMDRYRYERDRTALLCVGLCRRRKPREDFRELPTHGRAASCKSCEGHTWRHTYDDRVQWELEQARQKLRMYQRYAARLRLRLILASAPRTADVIRAYEQPFVDAVEQSMRKLSPVISQALSEAHTRSQEDSWPT
ncbi:hypothetical protein [Streptomyces niveus]|uniref:hypothetical protein n=1 Tax=Streptomyces niveus TaxID=193462 RepID=UPI00364A4BEE